MEYFHLTTPQQNIWNLQQYYQDTSIANLCGAVFYKEKRNSEILKQAIYQFIRNQSGMRLRFCDDEEVRQYVAEDGGDEIPVMKFSDRKEFDRFADAFAKEPMGTLHCALYRFVIFHIENTSGILVTLSHLIADAWTFGLLANQLDEAYQILTGQKEGALIQGDYRDYIHSWKDYLSSGRYEADRKYWEETYHVRPEKTVVKQYPASLDSVQAKRTARMLPVVLEKKMGAYCKKREVTPAVLFETALILYLSKINQKNSSVTIGVPVLNRRNAREKRIAGMFVSTMPLTVTLEAAMTVLELEKHITRGHVELFRHQKYPYADILKSLREKQNFSGNLYDVMISYQNAKTHSNSNTKWYTNGCSEVPLVIHIDNRDESDSHTVNVDYQTVVFVEEEVELILDRLEFVLEQIIEADGKTVRDISIVPQKEFEKTVYEFNDTYVEYPRKKCVHELFCEQAQRTPDRIALVFEEKKFTYRKLDEMSNSLAYFLREKGVRPNDVVSIIARRSWHVVVAMLGILKAGGAYMPVSPDYPEDRIASMIEDAKSRIALVYGYEKRVKVESVQLENFDYACHRSEIDFVNCSKDIAYVIFTSGSTGQPKGISVCHYNVCNYAHNNNNNVCHKIIKNQYESIVSVTNIIFDIFVTESLLPLLNGLCIYFASEDEAVSQDRLSRLVEQNCIDVIQTTPTRMRGYILNENNVGYLRRMKVVILGGEAFPLDLYNKLKSYTDAQIFNIYGPAETTVWSTNSPIRGDDITIGKPIANTQIYILAPDGNPCPIGVAGELCIAGDGVGKGYLNRPELTAERFVSNPFATETNHHGRVMYHTGDLARWRTDGEIEYLGRIDTQVKIRGLRIELEEIESAMGGIENIGLVAVAANRDAEGRQYLAGYYTAETEMSEKELRNHLSQKLPKYMIPNYFVHLSEMPMTGSGKIDRKNLPEPDLSMQDREYAMPETDVEIRIAKIWQELLHVERVGRTDDFFELGGDSLLAISMLSELETEFQVEISIRDIMEKPGLEQLAECVEHASSLQRIEVHRQMKYVLLPQQKAIFAACSKEKDTLAYHMPARIRLPGHIDREKLKESIRQAIRRHRLLCSHIETGENEIYGVYEDNVELEFEEYKNGWEQEFIRPFDLEKAPLVRVGFTEDALLFDMHHIVADGDSVTILLRDIFCLYQGDFLPEPEIWYSDYADYFYKMDKTNHREYFKEMLSCDLEPVQLPKTKNPGRGGESKIYEIPQELFVKVKKFGRENGLTDTMVFLGAYGILLSKYAAKKEILSSIVLQNRTHAEAKDVVGMFVNTLPICLSLKNTVSEYMEAVKNLVMNLFQHQELPFWGIADAVGMKDKSVINTSFVYQGDGEKVLVLGGERLVSQFIDTHTSKFDFTMELTPIENGCRMRLEYDCGKYDGELMNRLADSYIRILGQLEKKKISDITVLSKEEYQKIIENFNDTYVEYPKDKCIPELFFEQVKRTPDKTALVFEGRKFTYRELDEMSNSLAYFLREKGVGRNDAVPIISRRSWHVVVAMLGILKAGGAYMPVSPDYPEDRIASMIEDAKSRIALMYGYEKKVKVESVQLENFDYACHKSEINSVNSSNDTAYVIFTSGSTGFPKGIEISHRNLSNFVNENEKNEYQKFVIHNGHAILADTIFTFDISVFETYLPMLNGIIVYLTSDKESYSLSLIANIIQENSIDILHLTPTKMKMYLLDKKFRKVLNTVCVIMLGAERFEKEMYNKISKYSQTAIFNGYGPTETTIGVSFKRVEGTDITIGKPIANTQIYILDQDNTPCPIGVAGELCIAGDGVGKGYLNQPELTAERFVKNPFATEANRHGRIMYRTGDLACWRQDGEIEYLGRIDTQVKIRGLRIELGEIESVMSCMENIGLVAVAAKRDPEGRQYLAGYYTAQTDIDEKELRNHLFQKLPRYMVPNYFIHLSEMPMTGSGKIDRKSLPEPDFTLQKQEYLAPVTETQKKLCSLLEEMFHMERIGIRDDFFELGGDSLGAMQYMAQAHGIGINFALQNVFDYPTVQSLCEFMERGSGKKVCYESSDFEKYESLLNANKIEESFVPKKKPLGNVFLTGATGFLGAHVLDVLMREERGKIYCLIRGTTEEEGGKRVLGILQYYFGNRYEEELYRRIIPVMGDVEKESVGKNLPTDVQTVIHTAASVRHYGSYEYFYRMNTEGTRRMAEYAASLQAKLIHISTLSVSGNSMADEFTAYRSEKEKYFYETSFYIGQPLDNVYIHSKFEAEKAVYDAMLQGLDAKVIRVGNLTNRASDYRFQPNYVENAFLTRVKAILEFGLFPDYLMPLYAEFSPVDLTAEGVVKITQYADQQNVFHLNSNRPIYFDRFLAIARELGVSVDVVDGVVFHEALEKTIKDAGMEYIFKALQNDLDGQGRLVYDSNIHIVNDFTVWFLKELGFEWNPIDLEYIKGYMEYFRKIGYLNV